MSIFFIFSSSKEENFAAKAKSSASGRPAPSEREKECSQENAAAAIVLNPLFSRMFLSSMRELSKARFPKVTTGTAKAPFPFIVSRYFSKTLGTRPAYVGTPKITSSSGHSVGKERRALGSVKSYFLTGAVSMTEAMPSATD